MNEDYKTTVVLAKKYVSFNSNFDLNSGPFLIVFIFQALYIIDVVFILELVSIFEVVFVIQIVSIFQVAFYLRSSSFFRSVVFIRELVFISEDAFILQIVFIFPTAPTMSAVGKEPHLFYFPGDLYWIGSDKSCSTLIGRHKLGVVQMHVYQPLTKLWCEHLLNPAMQGLTERCRTQIFLAWLSSASLKIFISGASSQIPLIQDIEPSNAGAQLSHATLRFFQLG